MKVRNNEIFKVKKYKLDLEDEVQEYEDLLNNKDVIVTRDEFTYDKMGRPLITIWYRIKKSSRG